MYIEDIRAFTASNIYTRNPCILIKLNLQNWAGVSTKNVPGFSRTLANLIPELAEHYCSPGRPGGFIKRMEEGTYFGHVVEHTAIELQRRIGYSINFGKTRGTGDPHIYEVVFGCEIKEVGIAAGTAAVDLVKSLLEGRNYPLQDKLIELNVIAEKYDYGPSTGAIIKAARGRGIPVIPLKEGTSLIQLGTGKYQARFMATISSETSCTAVDMVEDKELCKDLLQEAGIPVPRGGSAGTLKEALQFAEDIGYPVVVKPFNGNHGNGVTLNINEEKELLEAYKEASIYSSRILVEEQVKGRNYRLLVVGGRMVAASERVPPSVVGDGVNSIQDLIGQLNDDPLRGEGHGKPLTKVHVDSHVLRVLGKNGLTLDTVLPCGARVFLRDNGNLSTGGLAEDVTDLVHPENRYLVERAAGIVGLDIAGVDIMSLDISKPLYENQGTVIEINAGPGIRMHEYPSRGRPRKAGEAMVEMLFPSGKKSRIPVISITGTNGKTTVTRMTAHLLRQKGLTVGMTTTDGIYIDDRCILKGDNTGPVSAKTVLKDPTVEAAVLETARGGIIRYGLGYEYCDIGVITNISSDHLGQDGINDIQDLVYVKSLVAESVDSQGYVILNADDSNVVDISRWVEAEVIYFSKKNNNVVIKRHLTRGGKAVFIRGNSIYAAQGMKVRYIANVNELPAALKGKAVHHIENALAAAAAGRAYGLSVKEISHGLKTFSLSLAHNPGRGNIFDYGSFKVIVDYGHNEAGFLSVADMGRKIGARRMVAIIGVPGDRSDELIIKAGAAAGKAFDYLYIKEDRHLRGRKKGEAASLLVQGVREGGHQGKTEVILSEEEALHTALQRIEEDDLLIIFYEKLEPVLEILNHTKEIVKLLPTSKKRKLTAGRAI